MILKRGETKKNEFFTFFRFFPAGGEGKTVPGTGGRVKKRKSMDKNPLFAITEIEKNGNRVYINRVKKHEQGALEDESAGIG